MPQTLEGLFEALKTIVDELKARTVVSDDAMKHMADLYLLIWPEACYDPLNESTQQFARRLLPHIEALNKEFKFKK